MQTSHFQLGLIATLAVGLGFSLASSDAVGYPAGAAVSYGSNPIVNYGGTIHNYGDAVLLSAPPEQDVVVTDLLLTAGEEGSQCRGLTHVSMEKGSDTMAEFYVGLSWSYSSGTGHSYSEYSSQTKMHFQSGIRVPAGESLTMDVDYLWAEGCASGIDVAYAVSGYLAQG